MGLKCTEAQHQQNRRTTVKVIDKNFVGVQKPKEVEAPRNAPGQRVRPGTQPPRR
jgi:hypothetical protein